MGCTEVSAVEVLGVSGVGHPIIYNNTSSGVGFPTYLSKPKFKKKVNSKEDLLPFTRRTYQIASYLLT